MNRDEFRDLSTDIKLVTMFEALTEINSLTTECKDIEARTRRNNLIFMSHPETVGNDD